MTIKTLHITNAYHPASGGIRTFYTALLAGANRHRRFVRLVAPGPETTMEEVGEFGRIYYVAAPRAPVLDSRYRMILPHAYAWPSQKPLRRILAEERPDLVEVCDKFWLSYLSGVLRREWIPGVPVPVIVGLTCERLDDNMASYLFASRATELLSEYYMRWVYAPRFDFHIAVSDYVASEVRRVLPQRLNGRLYVSPMGVDVEAFSRPRDATAVRGELLQRAGGNSSSVLLVYAGRLSKEKNLLLLPDVLAQLACGADANRDYRLAIAGDGPFAANLRQSLEKRTPGRTLFLGQQSREQLAALFHAADVFLHPNPREPFGIAPLEAMAAGLSLVAPKSGGLLTYANSENSWLAESTACSFADAVRTALADPVLCRAKIEQARRTAAQFSWTRITTKYFQLYDHFFARFAREKTGSEAARHLGVATADAADTGLFV